MTRKKEKSSFPLRVLESSSLIYLNPSSTNGHVQKPTDILPYMRQIAKGEKREVFVAFYLNTRHRILRAHIISVGTVNASLVHPREVFRPAIRHAATALIVAHNHPSGDPQPSGDDIEITQRLRKVGDLLGIELLDHIIVAGRRSTSSREQGLFEH